MEASKQGLNISLRKGANSGNNIISQSLRQEADVRLMPDKGRGETVLLKWKSANKSLVW